VWSYPQPVPPGIAASRLVDGRWYDLDILHTVLFPLTPGLVKVSPARLHYSVPLAFQFFSQEERYAVESPGASLWTTPLPDAARPGDFTGAVAHGLTVSQEVASASAQQGAAVTANIVLKGEGNVALWPVPPTQWPRGLRAYPDATEERLAVTDGRLGGTKTFRYLLVPDSAGSTALAPISYTYFDPTSRTYGTARADGVAFTVAPRTAAALMRAEPPGLLYGTRPALALRIRNAIPGAGWLLVLLLGPVAFLLRLIRLPSRIRHDRPARPDSLAAMERELTRFVSLLSARPEGENPSALKAALRRSGLTEADAQQVISIRERLRAIRFGGEGIDPGALAEARTLLQRLRPGRARSGPRWVNGAAALLLLMTVGTLLAQAPAPEQLYEAGAIGAAADGFAARVAQAPEVDAAWYNLGAARFRLSQDGAALADWTRAARLAPRENSIRRALVLVPPANAPTARLLWVSPVTPDELWLVALVGWMVGWAGLGWTRRVQGRWVVLILGAAVLGGAAEMLAWWYDRPVAVLAAESPILLSPSERAPRVGTLPKASAVLVRRERADWTMVEDSQGNRGWIERDALIPVAGPD
jgi:hypothetical protein